MNQMRITSRLKLPNPASEFLILSLTNSRNLRHIKQTHGLTVVTALYQHDNVLVRKFVETCSRLGFLHYAYSIFSQKPNPDVYLYNTMIKALSYCKTRCKDAVLVYNNIQVAGLRPDSYSFPFAMKAATGLLEIGIGRQIHCQATVFGLHCDVHVATSLIQMYSACGGGCILDAKKVFDEMCVRRDLVLWNAMVAGYVKVGDVDGARELFELMPERNVISWTSLISGYAQTARHEEAVAVFRQMQVENVEPDEVAMLAVLSACAHLGALELGEWIHGYIDKHGLVKTVSLSNALIDMYAKSGNIKRALGLFESMKVRSVVTWTTMIAGLALHGLGSEALEMFSRMEKTSVKPNDITFLAILSACAHAGLVETGWFYFNSMRARCGIEPKIQHYGCMIDLLGRAGCIQEAQGLLRQMPFEANAAIWGSLLASSNTHGDAKLGNLALQHLLKLEPHNSGNYALLSNIYSSLGKWNESRIVRKSMRERGIKKEPGGSFIEVNNRVHEFMAGETTHPQVDGIYEALCKLNEQLRLAEDLAEEHCEVLEFGGQNITAIPT